MTQEKLAKAHHHIATRLNVHEAAARINIGKTEHYEALKAEKLARLDQAGPGSAYVSEVGQSRHRYVVTP